MKHKRLFKLGVLLALVNLSLCANLGSLKAAPLSSLTLTFTHGVASGDVRPLGAVLWTRVNQEVKLKVEVSLDPTFRKKIFKRTVLASADNDFTAKVIARPLKPDQTYFYRWRHGSSQSEVGAFTTPPLPVLPADVRFAFSGDSDGTRVGGIPFFNNFEVLDAARMEGLDFFVYLGDTIYSDSPLREQSAKALDEYHEVHRVNREIAALRNLLQATSTYAIWDDHEVHNDFDGATVDPLRFANGRRAFLEYMPLRTLNLPDDPACADTPLFRMFRWGRDVDLIILDERSCRSADVEVTCRFDPNNPATFDQAPTLPSMLRTQFGLPESPPPGCLEAIFDPSRTMLGSRQKALFKNILLHSQAKFKFVINEVPIQQFYALPYDRWEGYGAERVEILNFIRANHIKNVIFLTTDLHANLMNEVSIDLFLDPEPIADEFVTGPIATNTAERSIQATVGAAGLVAFNAILNLVGVDCRHLDAFSYGLVEVDTSAETVTLTLKDDMGAVLSDQQNPSIVCTKTIGP
jgi:alkaline phosphatase D